MKRSTKLVLGMLLAAFFCVMFIAVEIYVVFSLLKATESVNWPTIKGTIVKSELKTTLLPKITYEANIEYTYQVGEKPYKSKRVRARGSGSKYRTEAAPLVDQFPAGKEVVVHYSPTDPADALLVVGADLIDYLIVIFPLFFIWFSAYSLVVVHRQWKKGATAVEDSMEDDSENPDSHRTKGPNVRFTCPVCRAEVDALTYRVFNRHAIPQEETFVECIPCGITRLVRLPLEELDQYSADELASHLTPRVSIVVMVLAIASVVLFLMPFVGLVLGGAGLLASYHHGGWTKRLSVIGLGLSAVVSIVFVCLLLWA